MLRLTETSPEHRRGDLSEGEPWLRCSGILQAGESLVWNPPQQLLLRLGDTEMSQHGSPISHPSRGSQGAPRLSAEAGFAPGAVCTPALQSMHRAAFRQSQHQQTSSLSCVVPLFISFP